jgi:predicted alpha/beta superfamily hydrolase
LEPGSNESPKESPVAGSDVDSGSDLPPIDQPRLRRHATFRSRYLREARDITVYLPPSYDEKPDQRFSILYLHDGQNLFDPRTSFVPGRIWRVAETADEAILAGQVEPLIIVGVANTGDHRLAEYTHSHDWRMGGGEADAYGKLLIHELMPFIATEYRVKSGREHTGMGGSSLGGLVSLYLGLRHSDIFGRLAVLSPSVWWNHKNILGCVNAALPVERPRIWLDVGDSEGRRTLADADLLYRRLKANGWRDGVDLHYERIAGGTHDETAWAQRVGPFLRFLYPQ